jgi:hypothetical protein
MIQLCPTRAHRQNTFPCVALDLTSAELGQVFLILAYGPRQNDAGAARFGNIHIPAIDQGGPVKEEAGQSVVIESASVSLQGTGFE